MNEDVKSPIEQFADIYNPNTRLGVVNITTLVTASVMHQHDIPKELALKILDEAHTMTLEVLIEKRQIVPVQPVGHA